MKTFEQRLNYAAQFCIRRAGTKNHDSPREFSSCIEHFDGEKLMAYLVRRAHKNKTLESGIRLMFVLDSLNEAAVKFGIQPLHLINTGTENQLTHAKHPVLESSSQRNGFYL